MQEVKSNLSQAAARPIEAKPKQAWHRPTVTFVSLSVTAGLVGSVTDGEDGSVTPA